MQRIASPCDRVNGNKKSTWKKEIIVVWGDRMQWLIKAVSWLLWPLFRTDWKQIFYSPTMRIEKKNHQTSCSINNSFHRVWLTHHENKLRVQFLLPRLRYRTARTQNAYPNIYPCLIEVISSLVKSMYVNCWRALLIKGLNWVPNQSTW